MINNLKSKSGMGIVMAMLTMAILSYIAVELLFVSKVIHNTANININRLKSFYLAKSINNMQKLRLNFINKNFTSKEIMNYLEKSKINIDFIWKIPFVYSDKNIEVKSFITAEDGKFSVNNIAKESVGDKNVSGEYIKFVEDMFSIYLKKNNITEDTYGIDTLAKTIADYIDKDKNSRTGGSEDNILKNSQYKVKNNNLEDMSELLLIKDMTFNFYKMMEMYGTILQTKGINLNVAPDIILMAIGIKDDNLEKFKNYIKTKRIKDYEDFLNIAKQEFKVGEQKIASLKLKKAILSSNMNKLENFCITTDVKIGNNNYTLNEWVNIENGVKTLNIRDFKMF